MSSNSLRNASDSARLPGTEASAADLIKVWRTQLVQLNTARRQTETEAEVKYRDIFVQGGADALTALSARGPWVQLSVALPVEASDTSRLLACVRRLIEALFAENVIDNFFFMRKAPGFRFRFEATGSAGLLTDRIERDAARWRAEGLVQRWFFGVYEAEARLFGGPASIPHVHSIFTIDSLYWLDVLPRIGHPGTERWAHSFAFLRALFDGLDIVGWEDLGVWDHIVEGTGRRLPDGALEQSDRGALEQAVLSGWIGIAGWIAERGVHVPDDLPISGYLDSVRNAAARWKDGYFDDGDAWIGPRQAAAYFTIYHWNRAGLSAPEQALIAGTLANRRMGRDALHKSLGAGT